MYSGRAGANARRPTSSEFVGAVGAVGAVGIAGIAGIDRIDRIDRIERTEGTEGIEGIDRPGAAGILPLWATSVLLRPV